MHNSPGKRLASALGAAFSVATLTAFAVAPLTEEPPPHARVIEPVSLAPQPLPTTGAFHREITISRGESVGSLLRKLGQQDMSLIEFVRRDATARKLLSLTPGSTVMPRGTAWVITLSCQFTATSVMPATPWSAWATSAA